MFKNLQIAVFVIFMLSKAIANYRWALEHGRSLMKMLPLLMYSKRKLSSQYVTTVVGCSIIIMIIYKILCVKKY